LFASRYGEASATDVTLVGSTDLVQIAGANVYVRNYIVCRTVSFNSYTCFSTKRSLFLALTCNNAFEGGGWALVRRVNKGNTWFAANDNLRGTAEYGVQNSRINDDSAFSILYSTNVWAGTEFLFMIGTIQRSSQLE
jgi:hypothetical protein